MNRVIATDYERYYDTGPNIYLKIPKCASTSIVEATGAEHVTEVSEGREAWTAVRNPYSRLVSCWADRVCNDIPFRNTWKSDWDYWKGKITKGMPFDAFVDVVIDTPNQMCNCHFAPATYLIKHSGFDYVEWYRVENAEEWWPPLAEICGYEKKLPVKKASSHDNYEDDYTPELRDKVRKRYALDFQAFGYACGGLL